MLYCNYVDYLQNKLGDNFIVSNVRNIDANLEKTNVVITEMPGMVYENSANLAVQIDIYTNDADATSAILNAFCVANNNTTFIENGYTILQTYTTPSPFERDIQIGTNNYVRLMMIGNLYIMFNISAISKLTIDEEKCDFLNISIPYSITAHSKIIDGNELATNIKTAASVNLVFSCINKETIFINKIRLIRTGVILGNNVFAIKIKYINGIEENYNMIIQSATPTFTRDALPKYDIIMALA